MAQFHGHALIIEDEVLIAMEIEQHLHDLGFETFDLAESPERALSSATARTPDLITADYRIIGGTGLEAVQAITAMLGPLPTVYITGNVEIVQKAGAGPIVDKPISQARLRAACAEACRSAH